MADEPTPAAEPASTEAADEAPQAATGIRATARWMAGAFAGIPSLAVIASLIHAPGDAGFDQAQLIWGVLLAAAGALIGILAFARVLAPLALVDKNIDAIVLQQLPEARFKSYEELRKEIEFARDRVGLQRVVASDWAGWAEAADAEAVEAEATVKLLEELLAGEKPPDPIKHQEAVEARRQAQSLRATAGTQKGNADIAGKDLALGEQILASLETLRRGAYGLQAGKILEQKFYEARAWSALAVLLVAGGVILLALAPKPKAEETTSTLPAELVTLTLTPAGRAALGCHAKTVNALKISNDEKSPTVITLPEGSCPTREVKFLLSSAQPLGTLAKSPVVTAK